MKTSILLKKARDLIVNQGWYQGDYACDENGTPVDPTDPAASQYCLFGALHSVMGISLDKDLSDQAEFNSAATALRKAIPEESPMFLDEYNDDPDTSIEDMDALFERAIESALLTEGLK